MRSRLAYSVASVATAFAATGLFLAGDQPTRAADHFDPPSRVQVGTAATPDIPADMADFYLQETASGNIFVSFDFGGPRPNSEGAKYDRNVTYQMQLSNDAVTSTPEISIEFRFGQDANNQAASGVRVTGLPGNGTVDVPCEKLDYVTPNGIKVFCGLIDDPFNFDPQGLTDTRATGRLSIRSDRNRFTNENSTAFALEFPRALIVNGTNPIAGWGFSYRFPGSPIAP